MKTHVELQKDVQDTLTWEPLLNSVVIGVKKRQAKHAVKNVLRVKALVENIEDRLPHPQSKNDVEIVGKLLLYLKQYVPETTGISILKFDMNTTTSTNFKTILI